MATVPNTGEMALRGDLPYSPLTDPDLVAQGAMRRLRGENDRLLGEAQAFEAGRQHAAQEAQQQYQQQIEQPMANPIGGMAALPYLANAFGAGFSQRPDLAMQGERAVAMSREQLQQRRQEGLQAAHERAMLAAKQAEDAGDVTRALQFTNRANTALKEYETTTGMAERQAQFGQQKDLERQRQQFEGGQQTIRMAHDKAMAAQEQAFRVWQGAQNSPELQAELEGLLAVFRAKASPLEARLSLGGTGTAIDAARTKAAQELAAAGDELMAGAQTAAQRARELAGPMPGFGQGGQQQAGPGLSPAGLPNPQGKFQNPFMAPTPGSAKPSSPPLPTAAAPQAPAQPAFDMNQKMTAENVTELLQRQGVRDPEAILRWVAQPAKQGGPARYELLSKEGVKVEDLLRLAAQRMQAPGKNASQTVREQISKQPARPDTSRGLTPRRPPAFVIGQ